MSGLSDYAILWDMDGVLVDTRELHYRSWTQVMAEVNLPHSRQFFLDHFGMNNTGVLEAVLGEPPPPEMVAEVGGRKEALFRRLARGCVQPLSGVLKWLQQLQSWGVRQAVASSAPQANVDVLLDELSIRGFFSAIVAGYNLPSKPNPAVFLKAASLIEIPPAHCLVIEDAVAGVEAARRAGMRCIAIATTNPAHALQDADMVVETLEELSEEMLAAVWLR